MGVRMYHADHGRPLPATVLHGTQYQCINYQKQHTDLRVDAIDVLEGRVPPSVFSGRIVLLGFLGNNLLDTSNYEDSFFSPLNEQYAGRSLPDIHGMDIHRNCISMVLWDDMIHEPNDLWLIAASVIFAFVATFIFSLVDRYLAYAYDIVCKSFQLAVLIGLLIGTIYIFKEYRIKIDSSLAAFALVISADVFDMYNSAVEALVHRRRARQDRRREDDAIGMDNSTELKPVE